MLTTRLYYEGWDPARVPVKMNRDEFMARVRRDFPYDVRGGVEAVVATVLRVLRQYGSEGEWRDVRSSLPEDLAVLVPWSGRRR
jgi:uncharacterized protein (DUF2267 family)